MQLGHGPFHSEGERGRPSEQRPPRFRRILLKRDFRGITNDVDQREKGKDEKREKCPPSVCFKLRELSRKNDPEGRNIIH